MYTWPQFVRIHFVDFISMLDISTNEIFIGITIHTQNYIWESKSWTTLDIIDVTVNAEIEIRRKVRLKFGVRYARIYPYDRLVAVNGLETKMECFRTNR